MSLVLREDYNCLIIGKEINAHIRMNGLNKRATQKNKCPI